MDTISRQLVFPGALILLFGLLLGAPYARAIRRSAPAPIVNAWRVAHLSLPLGATLMFAIAAVLPGLTESAPLRTLIAGALVISGYGFCVALPLAALTGERGLAPGGTGWGRLVYAGNWVGAVASIVAALALVYASALAL